MSAAFRYQKVFLTVSELNEVFDDSVNGDMLKTKLRNISAVSVSVIKLVFASGSGSRSHCLKCPAMFY